MIKEPTAKHGGLSSIYMVEEENQPPQTSLWPPYPMVPHPPPRAIHTQINVKWFRFLPIFGNVHIIKPKPWGLTLVSAFLKEIIQVLLKPNPVSLYIKPVAFDLFCLGKFSRLSARFPGRLEFGKHAQSPFSNEIVCTLYR